MLICWYVDVDLFVFADVGLTCYVTCNMLDFDVDLDVDDCGYSFFDWMVFIVINCQLNFQSLPMFGPDNKKLHWTVPGKIPKAMQPGQTIRTWKQDPRRCQKKLENSGDVSQEISGKVSEKVLSLGSFQLKCQERTRALVVGVQTQNAAFSPFFSWVECQSWWFMFRAAAWIAAPNHHGTNVDSRFHS